MRQDDYQCITLFETFLPDVIRMFTDSDNKLKRIEDKYHLRIEQLRRHLLLDEETEIKSTIFDLLFEAHRGREVSEDILYFINTSVKELLSRTDSRLMSQLRKICYQMIVQFSATDSQFRQHFSEICTINTLLKAQGFRLEHVEYKLPNNKSFDFQLSAKGGDVLVEVYNMDFDISKLHSAQDLYQFILNRLENKVDQKTNGLAQTEFLLYFIIVLWGDTDGLERYKEAFVLLRQLSFIGPIMILSQYVSESGRRVYGFEPIEERIKKLAGYRKSRGENSE